VRPWAETCPVTGPTDPPARIRDDSADAAVEACVQGQILLSASQHGDPSFVCLRGSHALWPEAVARFRDRLSARGASNYFNLIDDEIFDWFIARGCEHVKVHAPQGSMILWYSCTIHAGSGPTAPDALARGKTGKENQTAEQQQAPAQRCCDVPSGKSRAVIAGRAVAFVSQAPAWFSQPTDWARRTQAAHENRGTSHWTYGPGMRLNAATPRRHGVGVRRPAKTIPFFKFDDGTPAREQQLAFLHGE
jgi:hypothetical protein